MFIAIKDWLTVASIVNGDLTAPIGNSMRALPHKPPKLADFQV